MNGAFLRTLGQGLLQQHHQQQLQLGERDKDEECCRPTELSAEESEGFSRSISLYWRWCKGQKGASRVGKGLLNANTALILQCEHWLEAADPKHRYGTNLRPYFDYWLNPAGDPSSDSNGSSGEDNRMQRSSTQTQLVEAGGSTPPGRSFMQPPPVLHQPEGSGLQAGTPQPLGSQPDGVASSHPRRSLSAPHLQDLENGSGGMYVQGKRGLLPIEHLPDPMAGTAADHRFFHWLDDGAGRHMDLASQGVSRAKLESERVTYLTEEEREQVEVTVLPGQGLLVFKLTGQLVDTRQEPLLMGGSSSASPGGGGASNGPGAAAVGGGLPLQHAATAPASLLQGADCSEGGAVAEAAAQRLEGESSPSGQTAAGASSCEEAVPHTLDASTAIDIATDATAAAGSCESEGALPCGLPRGPKPCKWIYVLDTAGRLYVHAKYRGKFHHSSFVQGGAVMSAGGIMVDSGRIVRLTADSGHYRPNFESFMGTVQLLKEMGADLSATKLSAKHIRCPNLT